MNRLSHSRRRWTLSGLRQRPAKKVRYPVPDDRLVGRELPDRDIERIRRTNILSSNNVMHGVHDLLPEVLGERQRETYRSMGRGRV